MLWVALKDTRMTVAVGCQGSLATAPISSSEPVRFENHLYALALLFMKRFIAFGSLFQRKPVRNDEAGIYFPCLNELKQTRQIAMDIRLTHLERQTFGESAAQRKLIQEASVDTRNGNCPALRAGKDCSAQRWERSVSIITAVLIRS